MPYTIRKQKCKQSDGDSGSVVLSYTDKNGKKHRACHTSKKKARGQIAAIEAEGIFHDEKLPISEQDEDLIRSLVKEVVGSRLNEMSAKDLKRSSFEEIQRKFPRFASILQAKYGDLEIASASFATSGGGGLFGFGTKIPMMVTKGYDDPVVLWQDDMLKYNGSYTLADAVRNAQ